MQYVAAKVIWRPENTSIEINEVVGLDATYMDGRL
jgi:hypothetical protein